MQQTTKKRVDIGPRNARRSALLLVSVAGAALMAASPAMAQAQGSPDQTGPIQTPITLLDQGSFLVGGTFVTNSGTFDPLTLTPDGQTIHGDHAYLQYQIPKNPRKLPMVMWHGGGQFSKTWETTPDGRDGFQNIFLRQGYSTYILDQPHRGRSGRATTNGTVTAVPGPGPTGEQGIFIRFRLGIWPNYFPNVQFSHDPEALNQWWRQQTPDTAPTSNDVATNAPAALFNKIGPAVLLTHSASGVLGWITATKSDNVKGIYAYEPVQAVFPVGMAPPAVTLPIVGGTSGLEIPMADFLKLTKIPIEIVWGDNFPAPGQPPSIYPDIQIWQSRMDFAQKFVDLVNSYGGHAHLTHLPSIGIRGNTHFEMSDLNNVQIAGLLSKWLSTNKLDK
jgi:hypothetical protein